MILKVRYFDPYYPKLKWGERGNWIDLYSRERIELEPFEHYLVPLGVSIQLPKGKEGILAPRSSSFKNWEFIVVNSFGVIDETYCHRDDEWKLSIFSFGNKVIEKYGKVAQFRIIDRMEKVIFRESDKLCDEKRGGFGTSGKF